MGIGEGMRIEVVDGAETYKSNSAKSLPSGNINNKN